MSEQLSGKVALVTGASSGMGAAVARGLAAAGVSVAAVARRADRLAEVVRDIDRAGGRALAITADVSDPAAAAEAVARAVGDFGRLDILVNGAGMTQPGGVEIADLAEYRQVMDVNLFGALHTCKAALGVMTAQGSGDIINISSLAGRHASKLYNAYSASKHALNSMTDSMRQEVAGRGIRVTIVNPGATTTEFGESINDPAWRAQMREYLSREGMLDPDDVATAILMIVGLPRHANVSEISIRPTSDASA